MRNQKRQDMVRRTKRFALLIIGLYSSLPKSTVAQILGRQMLRSGTSVGAHYREARRAKSNPDFVIKIEGALQELDETAYWLELLQESASAQQDQIKPLIGEVDELMAIFVSVVRSVKSAVKRT